MTGEPSSSARRTDEHRGHVFGTNCAACGTGFTDEDTPTYTGPLAVIAASGLTMTCRYCREYAEVCRSNRQKPDTSRLLRVIKREVLSALRIPNVARRLGRVL